MTPIEKVREALEFYADKKTYKSQLITEECGCCSYYHDPAIEQDDGKKAQEALSLLEGHVIVPMEPTGEMCESGGDVFRNSKVTLVGPHRLTLHGWGGFHAYKSMIAPYLPKETK